ncbi:MAG: hypothetical protein JRH01_07860 [Deltaproteobacteria bacterium]|nr:hypothetical protein [Deltaproteobacteria bacterium]
MEWTVVIGNRADVRFMCTDVRIPGIDPIKVGHLTTKGTENLSDLEYDDDAPLSPFARRPIYRRALIRLHPEDGSEPFIGWLESHRAAESA